LKYIYNNIIVFEDLYLIKISVSLSFIVLLFRYKYKS
jgi:hypothetical protein